MNGANSPWFKGKPCQVNNCKSVWYFTNSGQTFCRRGHAQEGLIEIAEDDEPGSLAAPTRRRKAVANNLESAPTSFVLYGTEGKVLFLKVMQHILQLQTHALVNELGVDQRCEAVIRSLWAVIVSNVFKSSAFHQNLAEAINETVQQQPNSEEDSDLEDFEHLPSSEQQDEVKVDKEMEWPKLIHSLALIQIGCLLLRLPVTTSDIQYWTSTNKIPYMQAYNLLPNTLRIRLHVGYVRQITPKVQPSTERIHESVGLMIRFFSEKISLLIPSLNTPLILQSYLKRLVLPPELLLPTLRLRNVFHLDLSYHQYTNSETGYKRLHPHKSPEVLLMACLIIILNMCYGLSYSQGKPNSNMDASIVLPNWDRWLRSHQTKKTPALEESSDFVERDILKMDAKDLDNYLDWFENTWVVDENPNNIPSGLLQLFPLQSKDTDTHMQNSEAESVAHSDDLYQLQEKQSAFNTCQTFKSRGKDNSTAAGQLYVPLTASKKMHLDTANGIFSAAANVLRIESHQVYLAVRSLEKKLKDFADL
ncbi:RNA polymerase I upstream activation factor complex subunit Rrn7 [Schizosaccharomyces japonicus yFS275]|uniref:RNA polymerase I upstream activation factor complex subunit Rrn7 n=1 Tax=Schizosaccharomyces japonicus (strain yFS275 / FY16936) TaxID=402676 RepID=B6K191_SCHJY|nr:RNA polymerase I upstream activation factor complex subunit Rrn7 [Schizosaccharomyces japonicus yFS275]EEB07712.1 RNA polymerase I upstream activation factor complex subunit Rrn7 [Schizosaccharomyces japonicus yFS275]